MNYYLGIDGGGTKTAAVIIDGEGHEIGRGAGGSCSLATCDYPTLTRSVRDALRDACRRASVLPDAIRFAAVCAGVAGYSLKARRADFLAILAEEISAEYYAVVPDYEIAYWGASGGEPGIVVIAGTGAVTFGRNASGETHKEDGLGYLLGDRGSGFDIGRKALRQVIQNLNEGTVRAFDTAIFAQLQAETVEDLLTWLYQEFHPAKVASLAPLVGRMADEGEERACEILRLAALDHRESVARTRRKLQLPPDSMVCRIGGLWEIASYLRKEFIFPSWHGEKGNRIHLRLNVRNPLHDAAIGAALMARHKTEEAQRD